jgi:hypothetical protein
MKKNNITKEVALKYFNHLINCKWYNTEEYAMQEALKKDENFKLIEVEFKDAIEEVKKQLPETRLSNLARIISESFRDDMDEDEEEDFDDEISYEEVFNKLITNREYNDYDSKDLVLDQRLGYDDGGDVLVGNPNEIELDKVIEKLEKIKSRYPGQKIFLNTVASGTMSVDRIRIHAISKKIKPLYDVYLHLYHIVKRELDAHERDIKDFKRKQKELGL